MRGAEDVLNAVNAFYEDALPDRCTLIETRLELDAGTIPPPAEYEIVNLPDLDHASYPLFVSECVDTPIMRLVDLEPGEVAYQIECDYLIRIHLFARSNKEDDIAGAELLRHRLILAATELVFVAPALGSDFMVADRTNVSAHPYPFTRDTPGRVISPGYVELRIKAQENLDTVPGPLIEADPDLPIVMSTVMTPLA